MATEDPVVDTETLPQPESAEPVVEDKPSSKAGKGKTSKEPKAKKAAAPRKPRSPPSHPPYEEVLCCILLLYFLCIILNFVILDLILLFICR